jgi:putative protein-disulfide isomerase
MTRAENNPARQPSETSLVYVGDPLCSWCYGFAVPLAAVRQAFPACPIDLVMGGLRAYNTQVMDNAMKQTLQHHWQEVARRSGQPFSAGAIMDRADFVYDTEPACRAVVTVREHAHDQALGMYHAIQQAFYGRGDDVTRTDVLASVWTRVAAEAKLPPALDTAGFIDAFDSPRMKTEVREDFALARRWGISGFPTLLAVVKGQAHVVARGFCEAPELLARIESAFAGAKV